MAEGIFVALIRGINVGATTKVAMAALRRAVEARGGRDVRTVLNSGNVLLRAASANQAEKWVREGLSIDLGVPATVMVLGAAQFAAAAAANPFGAQADNPSRLLLAFITKSVLLKRLQPLLSQDWTPEALALGTHTAYLWCPQGVTASKLVKAVAKTLGDSVTMRSAATAGKIAAQLISPASTRS